MNHEDRWHALAQAMRREVAAHFPEWTDSNSSDPGITLLQVFAWLAENLIYRPAMAREEAVLLAQRLAIAATALAKAANDEGHATSSTSLQRVNYFVGQLLSAEDFTAEQEYFRRRLRRMNRAVHGAGVIAGLAVSIEGKGAGAHVVIDPGFALDARGEEIEVPECISIPLPIRGKTLLVQLGYAERPCRPVPVTASDVGVGTQTYSRIAETFTAVLSPTVSANAVTLARLRHVKGRWSVERRVRRKPRTRDRRG